MHPIQLSILQDLLFAESRKYSEMKPYEMEGSQFSFHLDKLIKDKFVVKNPTGLYSLTTKGKEYSNRMDTQKKLMKIQTKSTTQLCSFRIINGTKEYLIYKRLKNPFYGYFGFPTHKFWFGENILEAAKKGLFEETNMKGEPKLKAIRHYRVYYNNKVVEDKIMYIYLFDSPKGELKNKKDGEFFWTSEQKIAKLKGNFLPEFLESMGIVKNKEKFQFFKEVDHYVHNF